MKFIVTMKDPDTLYDAINDAIRDLHIEGLDADELEDVKERRKESVRQTCRRWFKSGEYLTVEIDTEAKTCIVQNYE